MTSARLLRISGLGLLVGAVAFIVHVVLRSVITAGPDPVTFATNPLWVPINTLGVIGSALVLMGLPAGYAPIARSTGLLGLVGVTLIALAWMFFGLFLSLYGLLVMPWLADKAPSLVAASAPLPFGFVIAFVAGLVAWLVGTVLFAIPFIRGRVQPRWVGFMLPASALWVVVGNLIIAPSGPATNFAINLLSNLGPVLLLTAIGHLGFRSWREHPPDDETEPGRGVISRP